MHQTNTLLRSRMWGGGVICLITLIIYHNTLKMHQTNTLLRSRMWGGGGVYA